MRSLLPLFVISLSLGLGGCAGYKVGPTNGEIGGDKSVEIRPVLNQTFEPRLGDEVTAALRRKLQSDGTYRLSTHGGGDIIVTGVIIGFRRHELSLLPNDVLTAQDYRVNATMQLVARDAHTDRVIFDKKISGYTLVRVGSDLTSSERQALPLLAEELAKNAMALLVDGSW